MGFLDDMKGKTEGLADKAKEFAQGHQEQVDQGMEKGTDFAKDKFGHEEQVDKTAEKAKDFLGGEGDQGQQ
ncbi:MAG: antitoxin [Sciscionella sp.]